MHLESERLNPLVVILSDVVPLLPLVFYFRYFIDCNTSVGKGILSYVNNTNKHAHIRSINRQHIKLFVVRQTGVLQGSNTLETE
jgi:hypothetical protein